VLSIGAAVGCVRDGYPLGPAGSVDIRLAVAGPLFAADLLDANGKPIGDRQTPYSTAVKLFMTENDGPAFGALVAVRVEPAGALTLSSATGEGLKEPTCETVDGGFRCRATREGFAEFVATSEADWSGDAKIVVSWANLKSEQPITVLPAGLPQSATNFGVVGLGPGDKVLPSFDALKCTVDAVPMDLGTKWRAGAIRSRKVVVRATAPVDAPSAVEHAPVVIESLSSEAELSLDAGCADADRVTRLRLQLDASGASEPFYVCFSDLGGDIQLAVTSGQKTVEPSPSISVDPEPRLLRVASLKSDVPVSLAPVDLFEVSAYSADRVRIAVPVDLVVDASNVLDLPVFSVTLADEQAPATIVSGTPKAPGAAALHVRPRLLSQPDCSSSLVTVTP
jgi:hypothetical protein